LAASDVMHRLRAELVVLVRLCQAEHVRSVDYRDRQPAHTPSKMSRGVAWRVDGVAVMAWAPETRTLVDIVAHAVDVIDRPLDRTYAGPCDDCGRALYVEPGQATAVCERWGQSYDLVARRAWLLEAVRDRL